MTAQPTGAAPTAQKQRAAAAALTRYKILAFVTGTMLLVLVFVAMPMEYLAHDKTLVAIVGPIHGFLYVVYVLTVLDLAMRRRWSLLRTLLVVLAGVVPVATFVAERNVEGRERDALSPVTPSA